MLHVQLVSLRNIYFCHTSMHDLFQLRMRHLKEKPIFRSYHHVGLKHACQVSETMSWNLDIVDSVPGRYSNFFRIHRLGPSIYRSPQKNIRNFKHPKKIFEILATQKNISILYLDHKKDPKLHRNDPQSSPIL